ncbi:MAG TPA: hypothetical protein ENJ95_05525 [Bacteroidetes bacterium]|nr:hypothetical protein [Bacteroidota bacterium]
MANNQILQRIKAIQARLGLVADGIIGPATLTALENTIGQVLGPPVRPVAHQMKISRKGLEQIIQFEIGTKAYYNRKLKSPVWPGGQSGVTIGIGYDLGYHNQRQIASDWKGRVDDADLKGLLKVSGIKGRAAKRKSTSLRHISIPYQVSQEVFLTRVLPDFAKKTKRAFPGVEALPPDAQAMLLSLVFNRGPGMANNDRRREMRNIRLLVPSGNLSAIAAEVRSMIRIWKGQNIERTMTRRRNDEAELIENARDESTLPEAEIILV